MKNLTSSESQAAYLEQVDQKLKDVSLSGTRVVSNYSNVLSNPTGIERSLKLQKLLYSVLRSIFRTTSNF